MIYFIQAGEDGPIKIGFTNQPIKKRLSELQTGNPYKLKVLFVYKGHTVTEIRLHWLHRHHCIRGEWFKNVEEIHTEIRSLKAKQSFESLFGQGFSDEYKKKINKLSVEAWKD